MRALAERQATEFRDVNVKSMVAVVARFECSRSHVSWAMACPARVHSTPCARFNVRMNPRVFGNSINEMSLYGAYRTFFDDDGALDRPFPPRKEPLHRTVCYTNGTWQDPERKLACFVT